MPDSESDCLLLQGKPLNEAFVSDGDGQAPTFFGPLGRVTVFVGANSSGKSRLMRELATRGSYVLGTRDEGRQVNSLLLAADQLAKGTQPLLQVRITRRGPVGSLLPDGAQQTDLNIAPAHFGTAASSIRSALSGVAPNAQQQPVLAQLALLGRFYLRGGPDGHKGPDEIQRLGAYAPMPTDCTAFADLVELVARLAPLTPKRIYVPPLRSAHTLVNEHEGKTRLREDVLSMTFKHRYGGFKQANVDVFTGHLLYERLMSHQCSPRAERRRKADFEGFLGKEFFSGKRVELVAQIGTDHEHALDGHIRFSVEGGSERELFNVGDGISAVALLLYPIFTADAGTWIFLEEPESHLHPAFQRTVLEALITNESLHKLDLRFFVTTHSNHLLDVAMEHADDVSVIAFERDPAKEQSRMRTVQGRDIRVLDTLGVRNSSVYLANCSIWVEGPSDVAYLRAFLAVAMSAQSRVYKEDLHYTFVEYGGSLLAHWGFGDDDEGEERMLNAAVTANRICIVADKDSGKDAKHVAWEKRAAGSNGALKYLLTTGREIENELSDALLQYVVADRLRLNELPDTVSLECPETEPVGKYLCTAFAGDPKLHVRVQKWCNESGTTLESQVKTGFASAAARKLMGVTQDDRVKLLGTRAQRLADEVLSFIDRHNRNSRGT